MSAVPFKGRRRHAAICVKSSRETEVAPKILFLGRWDWANMCNRIARAINTHAGSQVARVATENAHAFNYEEDIILNRDGIDCLRPVAESVDWVVTSGDGQYEFFRQLFDQLPFRREVRIAVTHAGTAYREASRTMDKQDRQIGAILRFMTPDLFRFTRDSNALPYFGTCDLGDDVSPITDRPIVSHSPTSRATKGSESILRVITRLESAGLCTVDIIEGVSAKEAFRRRASAHIHVDQMKPDIGGFGQSAIEAMGVGCAVLCDVRHVVSDVWRFTPRPPIIDVRNQADLEDWLTNLLCNPELLHRFRLASYYWSSANSAPAAVARYWLYHLNRGAPKRFF